MHIILGAHVSAAGGYDKALDRLHEIGGNTLQLFSSSPRSWRSLPVTEETLTLFREKRTRLKIAPVYFHASYLINLAESDRIGGESVKSLVAELNLANKMEVEGSIIHLGSFKKEEKDGRYSTLLANIKQVLKETPSSTKFIIENAGNRKIGQSLDEIGEIIRDIADKRVRVCLDTCHLFSAGYDLRTAPKLDEFIREFDAKIGIPLLEVWHVNDSRDPFASLRDRHENIGEGTIGLEPFRLLLTHPLMKNLPFIIETPGFDNKGPDLRNLDILKKLI